MQTITFEDGGKVKRIHREMTMRCRVCFEARHCPDDADFWEWAKSDDVAEFKARHDLAHNQPDTVTAVLKVTAED
jgi:hypothetical protein